MNDEKKRKQIKLLAGIGGALCVSFLAAPFAFMALKGLAGLIAFGVVFVLGNAAMPWFGAVVANWRLKAIKQEAAKNPVETLQNEYKSRFQDLQAFAKRLEYSVGELGNYRAKLEGFKRNNPAEAVQLEANYQNMVKLIDNRKAKFREAKVNIEMFEKEIEKAQSIWEITQATAQMNKAIGGDDAEKAFLSKLQTGTALDSIQRSMHIAFADLETSLLEEGESPKQANVTVLPKAASMVAAFLLCIGVSAQSTNPFIKGTLEIKYDSRNNPGKAGVFDTYNMRVMVANSALYQGKIEHTPLILNALGFVSQPSSMKYDVACDVVNPANPTQTKNIGRILGVVPIAQDGSYRYVDGSLAIAVTASGAAVNLNGKFGGIAYGKPLVQKDGILARAKKEALNIQRMVGSKTVAVAVKNYDKMRFDRHTLAAGPVGIYPEATVNGEMIYDYDRFVWYFDGLQINYGAGGKQMSDRLTGNIRYDKAKNEYVFDIRVNEPPSSESGVFSGPTDEAAFFATDTTIPALTGTMKYKDTTSGQTVIGSQVVIDLVGSQLTKPQTMNLFKLLMLTAIVPLNAE